MSKTEWRMKGQYIKNCNCIATCPCDTIGVPYPGPGCEGMAGMHIVEGNFGDIKLDGLNWVATYIWPGALHEGNGSLQPFLDVSATEEQRNALLQILSGQAGNPWFEILASIVTKVHDPQFVPIRFDFDLENRRAKVNIDGALETESAPLKVPATEKEQRVYVRMPEGMEYREFAVAQAPVLNGTGALRFSHPGGHSSLAEVEHTHNGLIA